MNSNNIDINVWVTQQALANELGVTVQCVHNWIKRNRIAAKKIAGSRLVLVDKTSIIAAKVNKYV
jgi:predicted transcriptional regulator